MQHRDAFGVQDVPALIKFVSNLADSRLAIARRLIETYPDVTIFTPMLVDMAYGTGDKPETVFEHQIDLHEKVSRLSILGKLSERPALLLPFVGFDPRSEQEKPGTLATVKDAVVTKGFAGIKMYPPMGFWPIGNTDQAGVDEILLDLYDWCEQNGVPITVHCNRSQGAGSATNDSRSDPGRWEQVLERYPNLRLNLGHFGGTEASGASKGWPEKIADLAARFDHIYADIGCHDALLEQSGREEYRALLESIGVGEGTAMRDRIMYGSDWSMLLQHHGYDRYVSAVEATFGTEEHERLLGERALDFLGVGERRTANGERIVDRVRALGKDPAEWLG